MNIRLRAFSFSFLPFLVLHNFLPRYVLLLQASRAQALVFWSAGVSTCSTGARRRLSRVTTLVFERKSLSINKWQNDKMITLSPGCFSISINTFQYESEQILTDLSGFLLLPPKLAGLSGNFRLGQLTLSFQDHLYLEILPFHFRACLRYIAGLVPDRHNKADIAMKSAAQNFYFPVRIKYIYTIWAHIKCAIALCLK